MPIPPPLLGGAGMKDHGRRPDFSIRVTVAGQRRTRTGFPYYVPGTGPGSTTIDQILTLPKYSRSSSRVKKVLNPIPPAVPSRR